MPSLYFEQHHGSTAVGDEWSQEQETTLALRFPLHRACRDGDLNSLVHLLSAAPSQTDVLAVQDPLRGWTPALWAAFFGQLECLQRLPTCGLETRSAAGQTVLHAAAQGSRSDCLHWLLQVGAPHHLTDDLGETALHSAMRSQSVECARILAVCGADYSVRNNAGLSPAQLAERGHSELENGKNHAADDPNGKQHPVCHISSNAYYGYQPLPPNQSTQKNGTNGYHPPTNGLANGTNGFVPDDTEMDAEDSSNVQSTVYCECCPNNRHSNGQPVSVNQRNGLADLNGRKRSMQETTHYLSGDDIKRMRHEEPVVELELPQEVPIAPQPMAVLPSTSGTIGTNGTSAISTDPLWKGQARGHRKVKINPDETKKTRESSLKVYYGQLTSGQGDSEVKNDISKAQISPSEEVGTHLQDLLLRGTHGCDLYSLMRYDDL